MLLTIEWGCFILGRWEFHLDTRSLFDISYTTIWWMIIEWYTQHITTTTTTIIIIIILILIIFWLMKNITKIWMIIIICIYTYTYTYTYINIYIYIYIIIYIYIFNKWYIRYLMGTAASQFGATGVTWALGWSQRWRCDSTTAVTQPATWAGRFPTIKNGGLTMGKWWCSHKNQGLTRRMGDFLLWNKWWF